MADGSKLPYEQNATLVQQAVQLAADYGAAVEAELGHISGDEEVAHPGEAGSLTDPDEAKRFVRDAGPDCLAVSIGNVHGTYRQPPALDFARLDAISQIVEKPLCLHGASGLSDQDLGRCVSSGIAKVNVNNELRERWIQTAATLTRDFADGAQLLALQRELAGALAQLAGEKLTMLASSRARSRREPGPVDPTNRGAP